MLLSIKGRLLLVASHQFSEEKLSRFDGVLNIGIMDFLLAGSLI